MAAINPPNSQRLNGHGGIRPASTGDLDLFDLQEFGEELKRLSAVNAELLGALRGDSAVGSGADARELRELRDENSKLQTRLDELEQAQGETDVLAVLREENDVLRARVEESRHADPELVAALQEENDALRAHIETLAQQAPAAANDEGWEERQREYEALLEEKSEVIRNLHLQLQEIQEQTIPAAEQAGPTPEPQDLVRLRRELEGQRHQLEEDEETLMAQLRQMEMALSKDRAELARQRQEVQRLHDNLTREIEAASREPGLRERLISLRRQSETNKPKLEAPPTPDPTDADRKNGLLRRIFG